MNFDCSFCRSLGCLKSAGFKGPTDFERHIQIHCRQSKLISADSHQLLSPASHLISENAKPKTMVNKSEAGKSVNNEDQAPVWKRSKQPITKSYLKDKLARARQDLCWRLVHKVMNLGKISCIQCGKSIKFSPKQSNAPMNMRRHIVTRHLKTPPYRCRACDTSTAASREILAHFEKQHADVAMDIKFDDRTNEFHAEIMSQLSACFGNGAAADESIRVLSESTIEKPTTELATPEPSKPVVDDEPTEPAIVMSTTDDNLHVSASPNEHAIKEQSILCLQLVRKAAGRPFVCRLCSKFVSIQNKKTRSLVDHVQSAHLGKRLYGCRICRRRFFRYDSVKSHYYDRHTGTSLHDNYDYFLGDDRNEVILLLRKCFDTEGPKQAQSPRATLNGYFTKVDGKPHPKLAVKSVSEVKGIGDGISPSVYKCKVCMSTFNFETVLNKHMAFFHRGV